MKYYYNEAICKKCGGKCCKQLPGFYTPEDIAKLFPAETLKESVKKALATKKIAIDWWEADGRIYFMRPATKDKVGVVYDPSWGGECVFLTPTGCTLKKEDRPETCKRLEPKRVGACVPHFKESSKLTIAKMWVKSKVDLGSFRKEVKNREVFHR